MSDPDDDGPPVTWVYPKAERGVWLLIADGRDSDGEPHWLVRAFTMESSEAVVQRQAEEPYDQIPDWLKIAVFRVGLDVYDADEIEGVGC